MGLVIRILSYLFEDYKKIKKSYLSEFFRQKVLLWPKSNSHLVGRAKKIAFSPLNYDQKVEF